MMINRNQDVLTGVEDLEHLYTFKDFPVFMGCVEHESSKDQHADMSFHISKSSGVIQLNPLLPLDVLYPESHGAGCVGASWNAHHKSFAEFIAKYAPRSVLEIGGGHGVLATNYQEIESISWTILEPNPTPINECKAKVIKGFFDHEFDLDQPVDAVVHSHVFEHIYQPVEFLKQLKAFLGRGKHLIFSVPNMREMLERKYTNCLNFEHTVYLSENYIDCLLERNGFKIVEKHYFGSDHSVFYAAITDGTECRYELSGDWYQQNKKLYLDYIAYHRALVESINAKMKASTASDVFLFGAHVQSQYLISFGLDTSRIRGILDNDKNKTGKRLYGTSHFVSRPESISECLRPLVVVRAGTFTPEIIEQIRKINSKAEFLQ